MMVTPRVSVVLATRNRAALLPMAVASVLAQSMADLELIVVDDGSTDRTPEICAAFAAADSRVRVLRCDSGGNVAAARNAGLALCRGEFVAFNDDDTVWEGDKLTRVLEAFSSNDVGLVYSAMESREGDGTIRIQGAAFPNDKTRGAWSCGTPMVVVRRAVLDQVGPFDVDLPRMEDFELWVRVLSRSRHVALPQVLLRTLRTDDGLSARSDLLRPCARHLWRKYRRSRMLPRGDEAALHQLLGHKWTLDGLRWFGIAHYVRAVRLAPTRGAWWLGLVAALLGRRAYKAAVAWRERSAMC
ncbi:MAG TPA: glycosyltransferase family A protein [Gemmatimonadaceae bacterium]